VPLQNILRGHKNRTTSVAWAATYT
jgi:hypothetical protein